MGGEQEPRSPGSTSWSWYLCMSLSVSPLCLLCAFNAESGGESPQQPPSPWPVSVCVVGRCKWVRRSANNCLLGWMWRMYEYVNLGIVLSNPTPCQNSDKLWYSHYPVSETEKKKISDEKFYFIKYHKILIFFSVRLEILCKIFTSQSETENNFIPNCQPLIAVGENNPAAGAPQEIRGGWWLWDIKFSSKYISGDIYQGTSGGVDTDLVQHEN